jgi:hypothetical protein
VVTEVSNLQLPGIRCVQKGWNNVQSTLNMVDSQGKASWICRQCIPVNLLYPQPEGAFMPEPKDIKNPNPVRPGMRPMTASIQVIVVPASVPSGEERVCGVDAC